MMSLRFFFCVFLVLIAVGPAYAGPHFLLTTLAPETNTGKSNFAFTLDKRQSEATFETPLLDLNYGVGDNIQLKY
jgi:hypothetical protein